MPQNRSSDELYASAVERGLAGRAYAIRNADTGLIKLGMSKDPKRRLRQLATASASRLELLWSHEGGSSLETFLHRRFAARHVRGEWFDFTDVDAMNLLTVAATHFTNGQG